MDPSPAPLPPSGQYLKSIRESSHRLREAQNINISPTSIRRLLLSSALTSTYHRIASTSHGLAFPLNFPSPLVELNLLSILSLLNIGSGYRVPLHQQTGRGAWDSIRALVFGLYLSSSAGADDLMSAQGMRDITDMKIAELLGVSVHVERPHESIPGVTVGEIGGPGWELVQLIKELMTGTGTFLVGAGYKDLGSFVLEVLKQSETVDKEGRAEVVLERLVRALPGFQDMAIVDGYPIYCFKKALFLINGMAIRFGSRSPPPFPLPETSHLPVYSDNVLPSILIHLGVIDLSSSPTLSSLFPGAGSEDSLTSLLAEAPVTSTPSQSGAEKQIPKEGPEVTAEQAYILRAAAIDACELIVEYAQSMDVAELKEKNLEWIRRICLADLDTWIWAIAKDRPDYRKVERFVLRNALWF